MIRLLLILVSLIFVILLAFMFVVISIPESTYRDQVEKAASKALNRPVTLTGDTSLSLFPEISIAIDGLKVANPDGFSAAYLLETGPAKARIKLWPLIDQRVEVAEISLTDAKIHLERLPDGRTSWATPDPADPTIQENTGNSAPPAQTDAPQTGSASIGRATLINFQVRYIDHVEGLDYQLSDLNADAKLSAGLQSFSFTGDGVLQDIDFKIAMTLDPVPALVARRPAALSLKLESAPANIGFEGTINDPDIGHIAGDLNVDSRPRSLASLLESDLDAGGLPEAFGLQSVIVGSASALQLSSLQFNLDDTRGAGTLNVDLGASRPALTGALRVDQLDLTPYFAATDANPAPSSGHAAWSNARLPFDSLSLLNAALTVRFDTIMLDQIRLTDGQINSTLEDGRLNLTTGTETAASGFQAFGGRWTSRLFIDTARGTPTVNLRATGQNISAAQIASTLFDYRGISGTGEFSLDLSSAGSSVDGLIGKLSGNAEAKLANGKLSGVNITRLVRTGDNLITALRTGTLDGNLIASAVGRDSETDFTSLLARFRLDNGIARVSDLDLVNPAISVAGTGSINLKAKRLDLRLQPTLTRQQADQSISLGLGGTPIPVRIRGDWAAPQISPDLDLIETQFRDRAADRLTSELQSLLSQRDPDSDKDETEPGSVSPEQAILNSAIGALIGR